MLLSIYDIRAGGRIDRNQKFYQVLVILEELSHCNGAVLGVFLMIVEGCCTRRRVCGVLKTLNFFFSLRTPYAFTSTPSCFFSPVNAKLGTFSSCIPFPLIGGYRPPGKCAIHQRRWNTPFQILNINSVISITLSSFSLI